MRNVRPTVFLFLTDTLTNLTDYIFHIYLGRTLTVADFATVQTINAALLILLTAFGVTQPVVARAIAGDVYHENERLGLFQSLFRYSVWCGLGLGAGLALGQDTIARWLNVPPAAILLVAAMPLLALLRPLAAGVLQGQQRFLAFGLARTSFAVVRLGVGVLLVSLGTGAFGAIGSLPLASWFALVVSLLLVGATIWRPAPGLTSVQLRRHLMLCSAAFVAYAAYMSLLNNDLIWVNRIFAPETAGSYASAVLLRRVLSLLPAAVIVVFYPQVVAQVAQGKLPDRLLLQSAAAVIATTLALTVVYFFLGGWIVRVTFGANYPDAAALLGWMGVGMVGYGLGGLWMNLALATTPWPFVTLLVLTVGAQIGFFNRYDATLLQMTIDFVVSGWLLAVGGLLIYVFWLRPRLASKVSLTMRLRD